VWRGIPIAVLADASWPVRERMLQMLADECRDAAASDYRIRLARASVVVPDPAWLVDARVRENGWNVDELRRDACRDRKRARRALARGQVAS
jgi:hypothetical protein